MKTYSCTRDITHKTSNISIERNLNRSRMTRKRQETCGVLEAYNVVMKAFNYVLAASYDMLEASDEKKLQCRIDRYI